METCESLVVKEENNPLEVDYSIVGVKELATPEIKKEVEKLQLETKGKDFMVLFLSHFLFIALPKKIQIQTEDFYLNRFFYFMHAERLSSVVY